MAGASLSTISAVMNLLYGAGVSETLRRDSVLMNVVPTKFSANTTATWRVKIGARNTAAPKAEGYEVQSSDFSTDTRLQASLAWAHYEAYASITGTSQRIAAANTATASAGYGPSLMMEELTDAANELTVKMSTHLYSGNVTNSPAEIEGLARAVLASGTYGGIDPGTYTTWVGAANTGTLSGLTLDTIRTGLFRPVLDATGRRPSMVVLPGALHDKVAALVDPSQRVVMPFMAPVGPNGAPAQVNLASLGFTGFMLDGVPFVEDRHCTTNVMYALTLDAMEFQQTAPDWMAIDPGQLAGMVRELTGKTVPVDKITELVQASTAKLQGQINMLAKTGDSSRAQVVLDAQLCIKRRNAFAKLTLS